MKYQKRKLIGMMPIVGNKLIMLMIMNYRSDYDSIDWVIFVYHSKIQFKDVINFIGNKVASILLTNTRII